MGDGAQASRPRVVTADRRQIQLRAYDLESILPSDHRARAIWRVVEELDLRALYEPIKARGSEPGRAATDPKIMVALWLYATNEGVGSARELERLCAEHRAYQWLCGGVAVNHHTLGDFRVRHEQALDELFTQVLGVMAKQKLISLKRVAQDGVRVAASAGKGSFRRRQKLQDYLGLARQQVEAVKRLGQDGELSRRRQAAQERAARERAERVRRALEELGQLEELRARQSGGKRAKGEPRASTTDPQARTLRMADGGYRPGYNIQLATETAGNVIVGVAVTNHSTDHGLAPPMVEQIERRTGARPEQLLVDGGYTGKRSIEALSAAGVTVYGPPPADAGKHPHQGKRGESAAVVDWRHRMATESAKEIYTERAATIERVNADLRTYRSLNRILVRGTSKVLCVVLWNALAYNISRWLSLMATR